ncbi:hypothetical protein INR49_012332 [Caranx melampygus]|nr:hypothetical protein INR49_012332 [Caranx melampygus]
MKAHSVRLHILISGELAKEGLLCSLRVTVVKEGPVLSSLPGEPQRCSLPFSEGSFQLTNTQPSRDSPQHPAACFASASVYFAFGLTGLQIRLWWCRHLPKCYILSNLFLQSTQLLQDGDLLQLFCVQLKTQNWTGSFTLIQMIPCGLVLPVALPAGHPPKACQDPPSPQTPLTVVDSLCEAVQHSDSADGRVEQVDCARGETNITCLGNLEQQRTKKGGGAESLGG